MSRIYLWTGALKMLRDYPFGVGGEGYRELSLEYMSEFPAKKSVHSTYFAVLVEWGYLGFILWSGLIIHTFVILSRIKGRTRGSPALEEFYFEAVAVQLALIGVLIAGIFHSRQYAEIVYWLCAFAIMLRNIFNQTIIDLNRAEQEAELATAGVAGELEDKTVVLNPHLSR